MEEKTAIAIVGPKGQIVIPKTFRKDLALTPSTKLCVYRKDDELVLVKLNHPLAEVKQQIKTLVEKTKAKIEEQKEETVQKKPESKATGKTRQTAGTKKKSRKTR